ncbi:ATP-dependent RNA helicase DHX36 [Fasciola hepatica]|uniref:ATP-dependent RNA helicase DHX36 n=1 Tax=Fasciola hepatica TaxID=6192 RepID=A0A4E0REV8_FASHE|nr:ATP-dependent RNA helicase DHX36 [Fasciola hepatica]
MPSNGRTKRFDAEGMKTPGKRPPPGLRGKEIGLWYASQNKRTGRKSEKKEPKVVPLNITGIDPFKIREAVGLFQSMQHECLSTAAETRPLNASHQQRSDLSESSADSISASLGQDGIADDFGELKELVDAVEESLDVSAPSLPGRVPIHSMDSSAEVLCRRPELDQKLLKQLTSQQCSSRYLDMLSGRRKLPVYARRQELLDTIRANQAVVISGATGCGKTTQIPQFILEDEISQGRGSTTRIFVTQPRRISAISVAERVAAERGEEIGQSIGYQVRLEHRFPNRSAGTIMYCTTGILLQMLHSDPLLKVASHIVVDEVHEREFLTDFLLTLLRRIRRARPDLRIILMSATLNADRFSAYFGNCPKLDVPGRLYPVETFFLEDVLRMTNFWLPDSMMAELAKTQSAYLKRRHIDAGLSRSEAKIASRQTNASFVEWIGKQENLSSKAKKILHVVGEDAYPNTDLVVHMIDYVMQSTQDGAILVFVPGIGGIKDTIRGLRQLNPQLYGEYSRRVRIYPLHSQLATSRQRGLFEVPGPGQRKIVVSTNIAETSVTIEDVVHVIDCGRIKVTDYDPACNTYSLAPVLVSKANAAQRRGRAGRVRPGVCYHLFSRYVHENTMDEFLSPEISRMRLEDVILRIKLLKLGSVTSFLADCMDPPSRKRIERSLHFLYELQTLNLREGRLEVTANGEVRSQPSNNDKERMKRDLKEYCISATKDAQAGLVPAEYDRLPDQVLLGDKEPLNALGKQLATLPLDPQCGKLLLLGSIFSCLEPALIVAACLSYRDPFEIPMEQEDQAFRRRIELSGNMFSDHWVFVTAIRKFQQLILSHARRQFCEEYFLRENVIFEILRLMKDYAKLLYEHGYISTPNVLDREANLNKDNFPIFRAVLCGALYPNVLQKNNRPHSKCIGRPSESNSNIHSKSVNCNVYSTEPLWLVYFSKTRMENSSCPTVTDSSIATLRDLMFFGGSLSRCQDGECTLTAGDWISIQADPKVATLLKSLRDQLDHLLFSKFARPTTTSWDPITAEGQLLQTIAQLLTSEPDPHVSNKLSSGARRNGQGPESAADSEQRERDPVNRRRH